MNVLLPRNARTVNEISELNSPAQFAISYKDGSPVLLGQVHDSLIGVAEFTRSKTNFDKFHAMQMFAQVEVYHDFSQYDKDKTFTGRELISILLKETGNLINYNGTASFYNPDHAVFRTYNPDDIKIEIDRGELKTGVLDKGAVGQEQHGNIFHIINNQYGPQAALETTYNVQQMALTYLYNKGVTVSMQDVLLKDESLDGIHKIEQMLIAESMQITEKLNQGKIIPPIGKTINEYYEELQINALNPGDDYWQHILSSIDPDNNMLFLMIVYGARGKLINFKNISSAIGQLEINGERMKENFGGRTLPYFTKFDSDPRSRGYVGNSYISGIILTEFLFHSQENRYQLINRSMSTSITGMQNRMAIKNLEQLLVDNQRKSVSGEKVVQFIYGADGADPRFLEKVKFPTMKADYDLEKFKAEFKCNVKMFGSEFNNKNVEKMLDTEFEQLWQDRLFYINLFVNMEQVSNKIYSDAAQMPVNINRIIEDTLYNLELKKFKNIRPLNPVHTIEKVNELCDKIPYYLISETQAKQKSKIPEYLNTATTLLKVLIRSYLNCASLIRRGINDEALDLIIDKIQVTYSKSLINYGKAIGIIAAQSISEPMTQMVLDSHHHSGAASTKKKGMFRIKEILGAKPTKKMKAPSMIAHLKSEYSGDKAKAQEIANHIEMLSLRRFVKGWQLFYEKFGEPVHPAYVHEKNMIQEFEKYNKHVKPPADLAKWCIRFSLDKSKLIEKQMDIETIYYKIRQDFPATYLVYSTDNSENIVIRVYVRNIISKKTQITTNQMKELANDILNTIIRGIKGIKAAYVQEKNINRVDANGTVINTKNFSIFCDGTNIPAILENPYVDPETVQSDSVLEVYECFGIAAARQKIVDELKHQVPNSSHRHYTVYADEMVFTGVVTSIDRYGSGRRESPILLQISDASPISVIENSAINGLTDNLTGVSPRLLLGCNPQIGDLYNSFVIDEEFVKSKIKNINEVIEELI